MSAGLVIAGYASRFGIADGTGDTILPGAFARSLKARSGIAMLWQHDQGQPIGRWTEIREDAFGLKVVGRLNPGVVRAREAAALLRAGDVTGLSIGFRARKARRAPAGRVLVDIELWEISLVTFPQVPAARARLIDLPRSVPSFLSRRAQ